MQQYDPVPSSNATTEPGKNDAQTHSTLLSESQDNSSDEHSPEKPKVSKWRRIAVDTWATEVIALAISAACLCAIVGVLYQYRDAAVPRLPYGVTLNAIISILGTAARSLLLYVTAASLGQLKWCWFHRTRRLRDMDYLDRASRGPMGSLWVVPRLWTMPLMGLGAVVMITALAFDPFIQQVVRYPTRIVSRISPASLMPRAPTWYLQPMSKLLHELTLTPMDGAVYGLPFFNAINTGIWSDASQIKIQPTCDGSSCEWPSFKSVGWCSKCVDAMSYAVITDCQLPTLKELDDVSQDGWSWTGCSIDFGHGKTFDNVLSYTFSDIFKRDVGNLVNVMRPITAAVWPLNDPTEPLNSISLIGSTFLDVENPLLALGYAKVAALVNNSTSSDKASYTGLKLTKAQECILTLCEREYGAVVANGSLQIKELSTNYGQVSSALVKNSTNVSGNEHYPIREVCWQARPGTLEPPWSGANGSSWYNLENNTMPFESAASPVSLRKNDTLGGVCPVDAYGPVIANMLMGNQSNYNGQDPYPSDIEPNLQGNAFSSNVMSRIVSTNLSSVLEGVAASLTKVNMDTAGQTAVGNVTSTETYVHVTWEWLILPWLLELLGLIVLVAAIVQSSAQKTEPWRTSILPLLFHGLDRPTDTQEESSNKLSSMRHAAKHRLVKLMASEDDGRTVLASQTGEKELI